MKQLLLMFLFSGLFPAGMIFEHYTEKPVTRVKSHLAFLCGQTSGIEEALDKVGAAHDPTNPACLEFQ